MYYTVRMLYKVLPLCVWCGAWSDIALVWEWRSFDMNGKYV